MTAITQSYFINPFSLPPQGWYVTCNAHMTTLDIESTKIDEFFEAFTKGPIIQSCHH